MKKLLLLPALLITLNALAQKTLTIQSQTGETNQTVNTFCLTCNPDVVGQDDIIALASYHPFDSTLNELIHSYFRFELSSIPVGSKVQSAKLSLFYDPYADNQQYGYNSSKIRRVTSAWDPFTITFNTQPTTTRRGQVSLANSTSPTENYSNIDLTNLVQKMVDTPATNFGFELALDTEKSPTTRQICFGGIQVNYPKGAPHLIPKMVIQYRMPKMQLQEMSTMTVDLSGFTSEMNIYPNPCNGIFNCNIKSSETENMNLRVIDILGRTVYSQVLSTAVLQARVNLSTKAKGTYFVILQNDKNETLVSQQLQVN